MPARKSSSHYLVYEDGRIDQLVRGSAARLARRRRVVEGRDRYQLAFDRDRDRQSGPRFRLSRLSRRADRCRDRALPRYRGAPSHSLRNACSAHSDVAPARKQDPGEKFPWARLAAAGVGLWVEPAPITKAGRSARRSRRRPSPSSSACSPASVTPRTSRIATTRRPARSSRRSSAISAPRASTASRTRRPAKRCTAVGGAHGGHLIRSRESA